MTQDYPPPTPRMAKIISLFSLVPTAVYFVVAVLLSIVAIVSLYDSVVLIAALFVTRDFSVGLIAVIHEILLTITVIVLFETVTVYFRTRHVQVRSLLVAGLTGTIRQILVINYSLIDTTQLLATVAIMAVLIAGVVFVKSEEPCG